MKKLTSCLCFFFFGVLCLCSRGTEPGSAQQVRTTAYTSHEAGKGSCTQNATDRQLRSGKVSSASADWSRFPLGTKFRVRETNRTYVVDDYGSALVGTKTIDLCMPNSRKMNQWGVRRVTIDIVEPGSYERSLAVLRTRTHVRYVREMVEDLERRF